MQKKPTENRSLDIDLTLIDEPDGRIRLDIDPEKVDSLADNIKEIGQIQPISLAHKGKRYEVIAGHLRYLAIQHLGHKTIKAIVHDVGKDGIALIRASENLKRTNLTPIEEAATYHDLIEEHHLTRKEVAQKFGIAPSLVGYKLALLTLHPDIQKLIHAGKLYSNVGIELNKIDDERELRNRLKDAVNNGCTLPTARIWVEDYRKSATYDDSPPNQGVPPEANLIPKKIYQACELCENPVEVEDMKMLRVCPACYKLIAETLKHGG